ncbi:GNAT family N-acetyltransferase [uncultured Tateyamaria sp.]|uniref:GNAT family N-acetyltransferase n=1 Tax=uncultured Tateyamaria sp. TaxID=455651 RepID=UPI00262CFBC6|nr:GNAT family N-acetyltransferase [uncultured Tateyamaria sp.]
MTDTTIRAATDRDVDSWRALRMDGILRHPQAFIVSAKEAAAVPVEEDAARLRSGGRFMAFMGDAAVGLIGLNRNTMPRSRHRGEIGPLYVAPQARGQGVADALLTAAMEAGRAMGVWQIELSVYVENHRAIALYERHGFALTGKIPNALLGAEGYEDDLLMIRIFDRT